MRYLFIINQLYHVVNIKLFVLCQNYKSTIRRVAPVVFPFTLFVKYMHNTHT